MVTCQRYWEFGRHYLERLIEDAISASWAGDRLICLGDYTKLDDLPQGMLTDSEMERIRPFYHRDEQSLQIAITALQKSRHIVSSATAECMHSISSTRRFLFELQDMVIERMLPPREYMEVNDVLKTLILIKVLNPGDFLAGRMVFRNLITKEYVRGDGIMKARDLPRKPWLKDMSFEHVLYIRTTWSSDPNLACYYDDDGPQIDRGIWAGHRFDVTRIGSVVDEDGIAIDNWKDVTEEVVNEVVELWQGNKPWKYV
ncbi:hypothetical protein C0992_012404 [Termitomyces sp. T32_za158]|nr:hypothetical protein C0992_012404 [Termitomyces sp. T32_za158]